MATVKLTQTITTTVHMSKVTIGPQSSVKTFFESKDDELVLSSWSLDVDLEKNDYWNLYDERDNRRYLVEFPKGTFKGNPQLVTSALLKEYVEWKSLVFGEWYNKFHGKVVQILNNTLTHHTDAEPIPDRDRIYYWTRPGNDRVFNRRAVKKHKRYHTTI